MQTDMHGCARVDIHVCVSLVKVEESQCVR